MARSPILHFTKALLAVPGFETIGRRHFTEARPGFEKDVHPDSLEICYLASGRQTLAVGGEIFSLRGGEVFVTQPGEVHSSGGAPREKCLLYWVRLNAGKGHSPFLTASKDEVASLKRELLELPRRFRGNKALQGHLEAVLLQCRARGPFWKSRAAQHLLAFAIETVLSAKQNPSRKQHPGIQKVLDNLEKNVSENPDLGELAALAGLSTGRFSSQFREATGIAPMEYLLRKKIESAKKALARGESVTDVALELGFSSSQYFATAFKRFTGATPSRWP